MTLIVGLTILGAAAYVVWRKVEVRLVLLCAALSLAAAAGVDHVLHVEPNSTRNQIGAAFWLPLAQVLRKLLTTFSDEKYVVPICAAMGFAFVLRATECDQHLVRLLIRPFRSVKPLLVPATIIIGFLVNIPLISQTSTTVAVGTVLVPLLRAARLRPLTIASALVLGASLGGELLNSAAPELRSVAEALSKTIPDASAHKCVVRVLPLILPHLLVATVVFWVQSWYADRDWKPQDAPTDSTATNSINLLKAVVPFIPLVILVLTSPPLNIIQIPKSWLVANIDNKAELSAFESRMIGAAMLIGVAAAALTDLKKFRDVARTFFEGAGYGFTHIIGLIVAASCFGEGIKQIGLDKHLSKLIGIAPELLVPLATILPLCFGLLSGSGMAATQSVYPFFVEPIQAAGADPFHVGAVVAIGAAGGRTASPVAAVTFMASNMTDTNPFEIAKRVILPILAGLIVTTALAIILK
jgi:DcuC family C4-dicarboxylate transporter